jgi:hypothetical protein
MKELAVIVHVSSLKEDLLEDLKELFSRAVADAGNSSRLSPSFHVLTDRPVLTALEERAKQVLGPSVWVGLPEDTVGGAMIDIGRLYKKTHLFTEEDLPKGHLVT